TALIPRSWEVRPTANAIRLIAPDRQEAMDLIKGARSYFKQSAERLQCELMIVAHGSDRPLLRIKAQNQKPSEGEELKMSDRQSALLGADYMRILGFLMHQRQEGNIVIITSNTTNICLHTNDLLTPARAHWTAAQFTGYNYLRSWRASREEYDRLNPEFEQLQTLLARDGYVKGYNYSLYRPDDAKCSYSTDYYLCRDYCGDEVRIGVSRPQDWQLLEPAEIN
ncbi:MAG TPA: hypothetical protein V6C63_07150, partial [Allocoleopsis sp.]